MTRDYLVQRRQYLAQLFQGSPIKQSMGMEIHYNESGQAVFTQKYNKDFDHAMHDVHGGLIATMIDNALWFTVAPYYDHWIVTVEFQVRLHEPAQQEDLVAVGKIIRHGKRLTSAEAEIHSASGRLIATGTGTLSVTGVSLPNET